MNSYIKNWFITNRETGERLHIRDFLSQNGRYVSNDDTGKCITNHHGNFSCEIREEIGYSVVHITNNVENALRWYSA